MKIFNIVNASACEVLLVLFFLLIFTNCKKKSSNHDHSSSDVKISKLSDYSILLQSKESKLINPVILKVNKKSRLFVFDEGRNQVMEMDSKGNIVNKFGGKGRGPGEIVWVNNMFLADDHLYVTDQIQFRISKFDLNGDLVSTMNYGEEISHAGPAPPPRASVPRAIDINNQPFLTPSGDVLLSNIKPGHQKKALYKLINWEGQQISTLGDIPEGSAFLIDYGNYKESISEQNVPGYYKPNSFIVSNYANPDELFIVYSALPKIIKYNMSGEKLWETTIQLTPEIDSLRSNFFRLSKRLRGNSRLGLFCYVSGASDSDGNLYLALGTQGHSSNGIWIHKFNTKGKLTNRYKLISGDEGLAPIFDIDFNGQRIFVITKKGGIRTYKNEV